MTIYDVTSGNPISGTILSSGSFAFVSSGGLAVSAMVSDQAGVTIFSGGVASFTVLSGGYQYVSSGGSAVGSVVSGGTEAVYGGGSASFSVVSGNGSEVVYSGGEAVGVVLSGGLQAVYSGSSATDTVVSSGGGEFVYSGASITGALVRDGGDAFVFQGGAADDTVISGGGMITVNSGAIVDFLVVSRGGTIDLPDLTYSGGGSAIVDDTDVLVVIQGVDSATLQLSGRYDGESFQAAPEHDGGGGTVLTLMEPARTLAWTGAQDGDFANAGDWNDLTNSVNPAAAPPNATDTTEFLSGGGTITGTGTAAAIEFGGLVSWQITSGASLSATTSVTVGTGGNGSLLINDGASIDGLGASDTISGVAGQVAEVTVDGMGSSWNSAGELIVGAPGGGDLTVSNAAHLNAAAAGTSPALDLGASGTGGLLVTGAGSTATLLGQVNVGDAGGGTLTVSNQGTVLTGNDAALDPAEGLDIARSSGGSGGVTVTGPNSLLSNVGEFVVGDAGAGGLSILGGGGVTTTPGSAPGLAGLVIGNTSGASGSSVSVSGAGSTLKVTGALVVGAGGYGSLSVSQGAVVTAANVDEASGASGDGVISVTGTGSALTLSGTLTVGDQAAGEVSILNGATVSAQSILVGSANAASSGNVDVEGAGSELLIGSGGVLNVEVAGGGSGVLTIGPGTTLNSKAGVIESGHASYNNNGGFVDPPFVDITTQSNSGLGSNLYDEYVENIGAVQIVSGAGTWDTPMMLTGTSVSDAAINMADPTDAVGQWQLSSGGTLIVNANTIDTGQEIVFEDATDTLVIGQIVNGGSDGVSGTPPVIEPGAMNLLQSGGFAAPILGYVTGDKIKFDNMVVTSATVVNGNTVDLFDNGTALGSLAFFNKSGSKTSPTAAAAAALQMPCFAAGTRIGTADGFVSVEDLRVGDRVMTAAGSMEPIVWIGQRAVNCGAHPRPEAVWPVRVEAGAFGENVPVRDLYLSPDHAVFVNDVLVPVKFLINGSSVARAKRPAVTYFHVELPRHEVILAEGLTVESYLDTGDRADFHDQKETIRLFPDFAARLAPENARLWETRGAARLVVTGVELEAVKQRINVRTMPTRQGVRSGSHARWGHFTTGA